jgi:hypothetical protein
MTIKILDYAYYKGEKCRTSVLYGFKNNWLRTSLLNGAWCRFVLCKVGLQNEVLFYRRSKCIVYIVHIGLMMAI